jgi:hypothetical protein
MAAVFAAISKNGKLGSTPEGVGVAPQIGQARPEIRFAVG